MNKFHALAWGALIGFLTILGPLLVYQPTMKLDFIYLGLGFSFGMLMGLLFEKYTISITLTILTGVCISILFYLPIPIFTEILGGLQYSEISENPLSIIFRWDIVKLSWHLTILTGICLSPLWIIGVFVLRWIIYRKKSKIINANP